jgi:hypothetical protein
VRNREVTIQRSVLVGILAVATLAAARILFRHRLAAAGAGISSKSVEVADLYEAGL